MRTFLLIFLLLGFLFQVHAQENTNYRIKSSSLGSSGSSQTVETSKGSFKISQSIGQSSVIGTHSRNGYYLRQGYQQPLSELKISRVSNSKLEAKVYPNPFNQVVNIAFNDTMFHDISILMFNVEGRLIYTQQFRPLQEIVLQIDNISSGTYFLKVASKAKQFNTKLIKL